MFQKTHKIRKCKTWNVTSEAPCGAIVTKSTSDVATCNWFYFQAQGGACDCKRRMTTTWSLSATCAWVTSDCRTQWTPWRSQCCGANICYLQQVCKQHLRELITVAYRAVFCRAGKLPGIVFFLYQQCLLKINGRVLSVVSSERANRAWLVWAGKWDGFGI